jgi:hypothetical protein
MVLVQSGQLNTVDAGMAQGNDVAAGGAEVVHKLGDARDIAEGASLPGLRGSGCGCCARRSIGLCTIMGVTSDAERRN